MNRMLKWCGTAVLAIAGAWVGIATAQNGITPSEILICAYQPMTGNETSYFRMGKGADAWFVGQRRRRDQRPQGELRDGR